MLLLKQDTYEISFSPSDFKIAVGVFYKMLMYPAENSTLRPTAFQAGAP